MGLDAAVKRLRDSWPVLAILGTVAAVVWGAAIYVGGLARASVVELHEKRITVVETKADAEREWRIWTVEQLSAVSARLGVPVIPPPVMPPSEKQHADGR